MNVERAKRLGWIVDGLELGHGQLREILEEEQAVLGNVPEGPACDDIRARERRCCEALAEAIRALEDAINAIMAART